jgi:hypothetical protein
VVSCSMHHSCTRSNATSHTAFLCHLPLGQKV